MSLYTRIIALEKLREAWKRVWKNKPAAGVDGITPEVFQANLEENLKQLNLDLQNHSYETLPVKTVTIYKDEKAREIALYSMRDKIVQQAAAAELNKIFDPYFTEQTYAYRSSRSALSGIETIHKRLLTGQESWIIKTDIHHFFETIEWPKLKQKLQGMIKEDDVLELIRMNCCGPQLDVATGDLTDRTVGIYQGSGLSPVLSNIYMMDFDQWMMTTGLYFIRYSDDMIVLGKSEQEMIKLMQDISGHLSALGLEVNDKKSMIGKISDGFQFLGYAFSDKGKMIPAKAEENLSTRLESMWLTSGDIGLEDKFKKALEIIGGWEQYFREKRKIGSILEFAALVYAAGKKEEARQKLAQIRPDFRNSYHDLAGYLADYWRRNGYQNLELLEYEQFYEMPDRKQPEGDHQRNLEELLNAYRKYYILENADLAAELMQSYTDLGEYESAALWQEKIEQMKKLPEVNVIPEAHPHENVHIDRMTSRKLLQFFAGREDTYCIENLGKDQKRVSECQPQALTADVIDRHLAGTITVGSYIQRPNATVHFIVMDVDISRKILLQYPHATEEFNQYLKKALTVAVNIQKELMRMGMKSCLEYSGYRGYHVWLLLTEWIPVRYANMFCDVLVRKIGDIPEDITLEFFPNRTHLRPGKFGQVLKLPLGIHMKTGERSYFLDEDLHPVEEINPFLDTIPRQSLSAVKKVIASSTGLDEPSRNQTVDKDLSAFGELDSGVREILNNCNVMRYLCQKARKTEYLSHFERLTILYVFGHLGEAGQEFVHQIMKYTLNYKYDTTEHFIRKIPDKPISCIKIREQYQQITAEIGCNCTFKRTKNCYPSPVLHAISLSSDLQADITLPTSRTLSKEKEKNVMDELNIHAKSEKLAKRILDLKKQQRSLDKSIRKTEKELERIYDNANIDCLETEMGMLVRRKKDDGAYEWLIEI